MSIKTTVIGTFLIVLGIAFVILAAFHDQVSVHILLIFPVVVMRGPFGIISVLCIFVGSVIVIIGRSSNSARNRRALGRSDRSKAQRSRMEGAKGTLRGGGVLFLGPIPLILWGKGSKNGLPSWWAFFLIGMIIFFIIIFINILIVIVGLS